MVDRFVLVFLCVVRFEEACAGDWLWELNGAKLGCGEVKV